MKPFNFSFDFATDVNILYNTGRELLIKGVTKVTNDACALTVYIHPDHNYYGLLLDEDDELHYPESDIDMLLEGGGHPEITGICEQSHHRKYIKFNNNAILSVDVHACTLPDECNAEVIMLS